jgi:PKD repeat protein
MTNYPEQLDTNDTLYLVHDSLRCVLSEDYNPGDANIIVNQNPITANFPASGIITLTEQCGDIDQRAISFYYSGTTDNSFTGLVLLRGFTDVPKPKKLTDVTQNVMAEHHDSIKDALISIEQMAGTLGQLGTVPLQGTMQQRISYLRNLVLKPKAWFSASITIGAAPLTVNFTDLSLRAPSTFVWDFGDGTTQTVNYPLIPAGFIEGTSAKAPPSGSVTKTYITPGIYSVSLTVTNRFGTDSITIVNLISVRTQAPNFATIEFTPTARQALIGSEIRTRTNTIVNIAVSDNGQQALDPIVSYNWNLSDDLVHPNFPVTEAKYSVGGYYDVILQTESKFGSYRVTVFPQVIDVIEKKNLWHGIFNPNLPQSYTNVLSLFEFGLISEVYKLKTFNNLLVTRNPEFLNDLPNEDQQVREFMRNNGLARRSLIDSGDNGTAMIYWATGSPDLHGKQHIQFSEFNGFFDSFVTPNIEGHTGGRLHRDWNWTALNGNGNIYFLFGTTGPKDAKTDSTKTTLNLNNLSLSDVDLTANDFENGADELLHQVGNGTNGEFSVYRSCWRDSTGFIARNDGTGTYFRIKSFYKTEGILSDQVQTIRKLADVPGPSKLEGELVPLTNGIYFFDNSGEVSVYNPITHVWAIGGPGLNSPAFSTLQDYTVSDFDSLSNTLIAAGDGDRTAYLSFDYSDNAFMKFNEVDATFSLLPPRPAGEQFGMIIY